MDYLAELAISDQEKELVKEAARSQGMSIKRYVSIAVIKELNSTRKNTSRHEESLELVSTSELLDLPHYSTHPNRVAELTRRAVHAIIAHNDAQDSNDSKWFVSAQGVNKLTGCRVTAVTALLKNYEDILTPHHAKHNLNPQSVRGRGRAISDDIDLRNYDK